MNVSLIWRNQTSFFLLVCVLQPAQFPDLLGSRFLSFVPKDILVFLQRQTVRCSPLVHLRMNPLLYFTLFSNKKYQP